MRLTSTNGAAPVIKDWQSVEKPTRRAQLDICGVWGPQACYISTNNLRIIDARVALHLTPEMLTRLDVDPKDLLQPLHPPHLYRSAGSRTLPEGPVRWPSPVSCTRPAQPRAPTEFKRVGWIEDCGFGAHRTAATHAYPNTSAVVSRFVGDEIA